MEVEAAKLIGSGLAAIGMAGAGIGLLIIIMVAITAVWYIR